MKYLNLIIASLLLLGGIGIVQNGGGPYGYSLTELLPLIVGFPWTLVAFVKLIRAK